MAIEHPYLMFLGDAPDQLAAKVAGGVAHWRPEWCKGQFRLEGCKADLKLPDMTMEEAAAAGIKTVIVGVANRGGIIAPSWVEQLVKALDLGMDVASGLHNKVADVPEIAAAAKRNGRKLFDVRHPSRSFDVASGKRRPGKRLLAVGTDCSVGKMYTALALEKEMKAQGMNASFRATGQTGIFIVGEGVSVDAVVADFISGCIEWLCPANEEDHWDVVEGQGSLFHASFAGVSLGLIHGSQPDALVLCHEPTRAHMRGLPDYPLPDLKDCMEVNLTMARMVNPDCKFVGVCINTSGLGTDEAKSYLAEVEQRLGLPTVDPVRDGVARIVANLA